MTTIINATPHAITLNGETVFPPSGMFARIDMTNKVLTQELQKELEVLETHIEDLAQFTLQYAPEEVDALLEVVATDIAAMKRTIELLS